MELYRCEHCGNLLTFVDHPGCPVQCCGQAMVKVEANTTEAATEKHIPVIEQDGQVVTVKVGSVAHPMMEKHYIQMIALETKKAKYEKVLTPACEPVAQFVIEADDEVVAAYEYCNLHGYWKGESLRGINRKEVVAFVDDAKQIMRRIIAGGIIIIALACATIVMAGRSAHASYYVMGWVMAGAVLMITGLCILLKSRLQVKAKQETIETTDSQETEISRILNHASHDIRTPMNTILNYARPSRVEKYNPKQMQEALATVYDAGEYVMTLMDDLVVMFNNKDFTLNEKATTIISCIEPSVTMMSPRFKEKGQVITLNFNVDKYCYINADEQRIKQILMNLLSNANRYTPNDGRIDVTVDGTIQDEQFIDLSIHVKDSGIGLSKEEVKTLSDVFADFDGLGNESLGLGLRVVYRLVHAMNGQLYIYSVPDQGSEFVVEIRCELTSEDEEMVYDFSILKGKHVLLVENNKMSTEIATFLLENQGITFDVADNGKDGVAMFTHAMPHTYSAILMDIKMPVMDGLEATKQIRTSRHPEAEQIPIIAMTADALAEDKKKSFDAGMNAHVTKPINPDELYRTLSNYMNRV